MPNRILKESICTSEQINELSAFEEVVFYRLMVNADDYGRFDGRIPILRSRLFPLKDIRDQQIEEALRKLSTVDLVDLYEVGGKPIVSLTGWERHQTIRARKSKYPERMKELEGNRNQLKSIEINCEQMQTNVSKCSRNPIQSNPIRSRNTSAREDDNDDDLLAISDTMNAAFDAAEGIGLKGGKAIEQANKLAADYSAEWLLEAINRAAQAPQTAWCWRYIEGILRSWKQKGGIDTADKPQAQAAKKTVTEYIVVDGERVPWTHEVSL